MLYRFDTPEQLKEINAFCKEGSVMNVARVWNAARNRPNVDCPWDNRIFASFYDEEGKRKAVVIRIDMADKLQQVALLKYAPSVKCCKERLTATRDPYFLAAMLHGDGDAT